jgi:cytochrome P450 family 6
MTYSLFELSQNQAVQDKARDSVKKVLEKHEGLFTYEAMMEMTYIENCISGTLVRNSLSDKLLFQLFFVF